jgi:hypothetical protein
MSNYEKHALMEFKAAGWTDENGNFKDEMQEMICRHVLALLDVFAGEGHSGSTAPYAINMFSRLAKFEPIAPLTGEDWEWHEVSERMGSKYWQNKRASHVFKDEDGAYDINGKVFWEWMPDLDENGPTGTAHKSYYTCRDSRVPVTFPYVVPEKPEYVYRQSDAEPKSPPQNEQGLL